MPHPEIAVAAVGAGKTNRANGARPTVKNPYFPKIKWHKSPP